MRRRILAPLVLASFIVLDAAEAQEFTSTRTDCSGLQLYAAAGVPAGAQHKYRLRGICREIGMNDGASLGTRWEAWVEIEALYDVPSATFSEQVSVKMSGQFDGPPSGKISISLKCPADPMITTGKCTVMQSQAGTTWPDFVGAWKNGLPLTKGKVSLAQATALSQQITSKPPPPPPPAPPKSRTPVQGAAKAAASAQAGNTSRTAGSAAASVATGAGARESATEIALQSGAHIALQNGRALAGLVVDGSLRWNIVGPNAETLRTFPEGSRAFRSAAGTVSVDWGGGVYNAGVEKQPTLKRPN